MQKSIFITVKVEFIIIGVWTISTYFFKNCMMLRTRESIILKAAFRLLSMYPLLTTLSMSPFTLSYCRILYLTDSLYYYVIDFLISMIVFHRFVFVWKQCKCMRSNLSSHHIIVICIIGHLKFSWVLMFQHVFELVEGEWYWGFEREKREYKSYYQWNNLKVRTKKNEKRKSQALLVPCRMSCRYSRY